MADLTTVANAAAWLGVDASDPFLPRLVASASAVVEGVCGQVFDVVLPAVVPPAVEQATLDVVANLYRNRSLNPLVSSISLGDGSISYRGAEESGALTPLALALLAPYRKVFWSSSL